MMRFILGMALGLGAGYLFGSERAREEARRRVANAPEPLRQATERVSGAIAGAPVPDSLKQTASRATASVQSAAERVAQSAAPAPQIVRPTPGEVAGRPAEPMPTGEGEPPA